MKLIPTPKRVRPDDSLGQGMDTALTIVLFFGLGALLDWWLGTTPLFMIALVLVAAIGVFVKIRYTYEARMQELDAERAQAHDRRTARAVVEPESPPTGAAT